MFSPRLYLAAVPLLFILNACPTIWQYNALKDEVAAVEREKDDLSQRLERYEKRMANLDSKYDSRLGEVLERGADSSAQLDELGLELTRAKGKIEELEFYIARLKEMTDRMATLLDERLGVNVLAVPEYAPKDKDERFALAKQKLELGDTRMARSLFRTILTDHPNDELADDAQHMVGETFFAEQKYAQAIREYRAVHDKYRKSPFVLASLLRIGECFVATSACKKAIQIFEYARDFAKEKADKDELTARIKETRKTCK